MGAHHGVVRPCPHNYMLLGVGALLPHKAGARQWPNVPNEGVATWAQRYPIPPTPPTLTP